jgi:hypothetical protein
MIFAGFKSRMTGETKADMGRKGVAWPGVAILRIKGHLEKFVAQTYEQSRNII